RCGRPAGSSAWRGLLQHRQQLPHGGRVKAGRDPQAAAARQDDLDAAGRGRFQVGDDPHRQEGDGGGIALTELAPPGVEAGWGERVAGTEGPDTQATVLPLLHPASPALFGARIARLALGHGVALLSEAITPRPSRTLFTGRTRM